MVPLPTYTYRPVDAGQSGFRIAVLEPAASFEAALCCTLVEVSVNSLPDYEVISYVWGDPSKTTSIEVEGSTLMVTVNLDLVLRYIRLKDRQRYIWADAICIDQANSKERGQQVQLMKDIYSLCTRDLIWVGESDERTEQGIQALRRMKSLNIFRKGGRPSFYRGSGNGEYVSLRHLGLQWDDQVAMDSILKKPPIWQRVWVIQEISCCPDALVLVGNRSVSWSVISSILDHSGIPDRFHGPFSHASFETDVWETFSVIQVIEHQRDSFSNVQPINSTLLDVLSRFRETYSTDPRDKIYGLLGLATDIEIIPDYQKSVRDVYIEVAQAQIGSENNLDIITQSLWPLGSETEGSTGFVPSAMDLPSWVPNFSSTSKKTLLFAQRDIFAAGPSTFLEPIEITSSGRLRVRGTILGTVAVLKKLGTDEQTLTPSNWAKTTLPVAFDDPSNPRQYPTGGDAFEAYWRTLLADCCLYPARRLSIQDIEQYSELFANWRQYLDIDFPKVADRGWDLEANGSERQRAAYQYIREINSLRYLKEKIGKWKFAELDNGSFAMVPCAGCSRAIGVATEVGDDILVVDGGKVPLAVRKVVRNGSKVCNEGPEWEVLGAAYVHGFMDGRVMEWIEDGLLKWDLITLV